MYSLFGILHSPYSRVTDSIFAKLFFSVFLLFNIYHAKSTVAERYNGWQNKYFKEKQDIYTITPYLRNIGIDKNDKIIFIPDDSNVSLYLMNQPGWTQYTDARFNREAPIKYNQDSIEISESIKKGAKYLIANNTADIYLYPYIKC